MVKVCGMTLPEQVKALDGLGVDLLGFIFAAKSPRRVTPEHVASIARGRAKRVGVFVEQDADAVNRIMEAAGLDYAQLHAGQDEAFCRTVGHERVIKVFWPQRYLVVGSPNPIAQAGTVDPAAALEALERDMDRFTHSCALMLLDSGTSGGGHGKSLDFAALSGLRAPKPWLLAGGLSPDNAALALREAHPAGLDLNSGVESSPGVKDISRVTQALHIIKSF
ncbi:phosphoribosylanthranilate isomerase [Fundidesulfovibrio terrae]|uniref:phosphoribosylanthranilate isomerase n=1 Tax=Fundidesulfovibrio terrae TaxID=2922866 RepID=UPI001FAF6E9F|nr:phosphoribosylanthranilate isomerase [Fundidesulfovibrio terrae]